MDLKTFFLKKIKMLLLYCFGMLPLIVGFTRLFTQRLGADPVIAIEQILGFWAFIYLLICLSLTPFTKITHKNFKGYRRLFGLLSFIYAVAHTSFYIIIGAGLDLHTLETDLLDRPFFQFGFTGILLLLPRALTSNQWSIRKLKKKWQTLHTLVYPAALCAAIHYYLAFKGWTEESSFYISLMAVLLLWRIRKLLASKVRARLQ